MNTLPDKMSELLRLAVSDSKKIEGQSNYAFDMHLWIEKKNDICYTCMAGAVMTCSLDINPEPSKRYIHDFFDPSHSDSLVDKMEAINHIRKGDLQYAARRLDIELNDIFIECNKLIGNDWNTIAQRASWDTYLKVADILEANGF